MGLLVDQHPDAGDDCMLSMVKGSNGPAVPAVAFGKRPLTISLNGDVTIETFRLEWTSPIDVSSDQLLRARRDFGLEQGQTAD